MSLSEPMRYPRTTIWKCPQHLKNIEFHFYVKQFPPFDCFVFPSAAYLKLTDFTTDEVILSIIESI